MRYKLGMEYKDVEEDPEAALNYFVFIACLVRLVEAMLILFLTAKFKPVLVVLFLVPIGLAVLGLFGRFVTLYKDKEKAMVMVFFGFFLTFVSYQIHYAMSFINPNTKSVGTTNTINNNQGKKATDFDVLIDSILKEDLTDEERNNKLDEVIEEIIKAKRVLIKNKEKILLDVPSSLNEYKIAELEKDIKALNSLILKSKEHKIEKKEVLEKESVEIKDFKEQENVSIEEIKIEDPIIEDNIKVDDPIIDVKPLEVIEKEEAIEIKDFNESENISIEEINIEDPVIEDNIKEEDPIIDIKPLKEEKVNKGETLLQSLERRASNLDDNHKAEYLKTKQKYEDGILTEETYISILEVLLSVTDF